MSKFRLIVTVLAALAFAAIAPAATYYVNGSHNRAADRNPGTQAAPWKTIAHAASTAKPGDVVIVLPGQYDEAVTLKTSGTQDKPITFRAGPTRKARVASFRVDADYIVIEGFEITSDKAKFGIHAGEAHRKNARIGNRFINNYLHDIKGTAIYTGEKAVVKDNLLKNVYRGAFVNSGTLFENNEIDTLVAEMVERNGKTQPNKTQYTFFAGDHITFRGNYFHGAPEEHLITGMGVCFFASWDEWIIGPSNHILIENNRCFNATHASEPTANKLQQSSHITYRNNVFVNTVYVGVMPKKFTHVTVENNTFINCGAYPIWLQGPQCETAVVRNNLITYMDRDRVVEKFGWKPSESGIRIDFGGDKSFADHNLFHGCVNRGYGKNDVTAEPQFVDPANGDYRLKPGSPGIDAGTTIEAVKTDVRGVERPQGKGYDIGAYEYDPAQR